MIGRDPTWSLECWTCAFYSTWRLTSFFYGKTFSCFCCHFSRHNHMKQFTTSDCLESKRFSLLNKNIHLKLVLFAKFYLLLRRLSFDVYDLWKKVFVGKEINLWYHCSLSLYVYINWFTSTYDYVYIYISVRIHSLLLVSCFPKKTSYITI